MDLMTVQFEKDILETIKLYAQKNHSYDIEAILLSSDSGLNYVISVNGSCFLGNNIKFAISLYKCPEYALKLLDDAFASTMQDMFRNHDLKHKMILKENVHARFTNLPSYFEIYHSVLPKCSNIGQFLCISGTIIRATISKMLEFRKEWRCTKCKHTFIVDAKVEQDYAVIKPAVCPNTDPCNNKNFTLLSNNINANWCRDYQEVKVQEQVKNLVVGTVPRSMWVILENDLVDCCQPGNDVIISGIVHTRWKRLVKGQRSDIELVLLAHNIEVKNNGVAMGTVPESSLKEFEKFWLQYHNDPLQGRDFILSCLCPQVFGLYIVKLAVALVLAGGVQRIDNNSVIRGDSHLLLVGDPGTGKSQFLKYASKISRRSVLTSGIGTTNAGLTAAAVKDGGKWQLEAGALVLADGGICCIDEFSSIKEHDKASIHEAMEQQTISVAKAGLVCKLNTQCSILASTNPKGKYNKNESLSVNTAMASPLLSRFDIILVLLDTYDENWDKLVSSYILEEKDIALEHGTKESWSMDKMKAYFSAIRNINPKLTDDCDRVLKAYYRKHRSSEIRSAARTTPRLLQSLIRLAQGHARLMFRMDVLVIDAIVAISVMESSMVGCSLFDGIDALHTTFPENPDEDYRKRAKFILEALELEDLVKKELCFDQENHRDQELHEIICTQINSHSTTSTSCNMPVSKQAKQVIRHDSEDSLDNALVDIDPFADDSNDFEENIFENPVKLTKLDVEWSNSFLGSINRSISHFSPRVISTQHEEAVEENSQTVKYDTEEEETTKMLKNENTVFLSPVSKKRRVEYFNLSANKELHKIPINQKAILRNNVKDKSALLIDNVTTLSELNAEFSTQLQRDATKLAADSVIKPRNAKENDLNLLESFAFKPKQPHTGNYKPPVCSSKNRSQQNLKGNSQTNLSASSSLDISNFNFDDL